MNLALFDVRSGERRNAIGAFLTLFGMLAGALTAYLQARGLRAR